MATLELNNPSIGESKTGSSYDILGIYEVCGSTYAIFCRHDLMAREIIVDDNIMYVAPKESPMSNHILATYRSNMMDYYVDGTMLELPKLPCYYKENAEEEPKDFVCRHDLFPDGGTNITFMGSILGEDAFAKKRFDKFREGDLSKEMQGILLNHSGGFRLKKRKYEK